ncbi:hypothetical protein Amet_1857 [Alkaliphilus metalliredigens QYMF]|uniref:Cxxc_20_cxxc protein n=1 Tax=Alkaliphilus metalliredigens (strain QYMF) TaxID=293826 RepID=A6TPA8_ALKMQ|nr:TIGR04104 family putative zinc finger protein [Alkaliphilus metalliredigens]ABR48026.1 hypothetical protein Amet_1857 [Alkaliphilus metalliredigens QYMF]
MKLQGCKNCETKFSYKAIQRAFFSKTEKRFKCENCGTEHKLKRDYHRIISIIVVLPMFLHWFLISLDRLLVLSITIAYVIAIILLIPNIVKYDKI